MKRIKQFLLLFILGFNFQLFAVNDKVDSLEILLNSEKQDTSKALIYHKLYLLTDEVNYIEKCLEFSKKSNYQKGLAISYRDFGRYYFFSSKKDIALDYLNKAVKIALKIKDKNLLQSAYRYIGYIYMMNDPFTAKEYYEKSLKICLELNDEISESYAYSAIGNVYEGMKTKKDNFKIALRYYEKSLKIREKYGDESEIAASLNETSRVYRWLGQNEKSTALLFRGLEIAEKTGSVENIVYICNSIGNDYVYRFHDYKKALFYQLKAYSFCLKKKDNIELMFEITKILAHCYSKLGDQINANKYYNMSMLYNDSIRERTNLYDYNLSSIKHALEAELAKQKILLKKAEISKRKTENERQVTFRNTILAGLLFLIILFFIILRGYRQKQKTNLELDLKNQKIQVVSNDIEKQKLTLEENNSKLQQLLKDKEILFKEVHHRVKNNLQIISSLLNLQSNTISDIIVIDVLKQSQSRINTMAILHNKLYQTEDFTNVPIDEYLNQLVSSISDSFNTDKCNVKFHIDADSTIELNIDIAIPFGLILNELVTNSFKHAFPVQNAGIISVSLKKFEYGKFQFVYKDNGIGLPDDFRENVSKSLGLELIEMLVQQINGVLVIKNIDGAYFEIIFDENQDTN